MGRTGRNGLRIAGRYRLVEKLGTGGMSVVWRGYDETLGRSVAVKVLSPRHADDQVFRDRLRQEAVAAARLSHPHITGIFDFGESPLSERLTVPYVVMELNDGESVAARLGRQGPLPWREAVTIATEVASALATAHARGLVHRDVTPANVMLTGAGAKVVDFGISAIVGQRDAAPDGSLLGTPAYLAPERLAGAQVSAATDVYALGLLLYRTLTGRLPWSAETTAEALRAHLYADPNPLPSLPGMPAAVAAMCLSCLAKNPHDRPSAAAAARALGAAVGLQPIIPPMRDRPDDAPPPVRAAAAAIPVHRSDLPLVPGSRSAWPLSRWSLARRGRALLAYLGLPYASPARSVSSTPSSSPSVSSTPSSSPSVSSAAAYNSSSTVSAVAASCSPPPASAAASRVSPSAASAGAPFVSPPAAAPCLSPLPASATAPCVSPSPPSAAASMSAAPSFDDLERTASSLAGPIGLLRLRAGLRLGGMLRLGGAIQPLGGGVFAGGGLARQLLTGRGPLRGRHRLQAVLVTTALLATAGLGWAATREAPDVEQAQAAGAAPAAGAPSGRTYCAVRYQLRRDSGRDYEALLTVATTDEVGRSPWRVQFSYPGSQRLTDVPKTVTQRGRKVVAKGSGKLHTFTLRGAYHGYNPLPIVFSLDGQKCRAEVLGSTTPSRTEAEPISEAAGSEAKRPGSEGKRNRPPGKSSIPQKRVKPGPAPSLPPPVRSGFSLALR